jgi:phosphoribosylformylglycinamidine synthase subunit PurS
VLVRPKAGILDPQGVAVERALPALGFGGVANVHVGRLVELDVEDASQIREMCEKLLANPLVEDYEIQLVDADGGRDASAGSGRQGSGGRQGAGSGRRASGGRSLDHR